MGRTDAIIFTGGIGENSRLVRRLVTESLTGFGISIDPKKNEKNEPDISAGRVKILIIPTNEELAIARDTKNILESLEKEEAVRPSPAVEKRPAVFSPAETARLVLLWAQNPKADFARLAAKLARDIGRIVGAEAVQKELERLSLTAAAIPQNKAK